MRHGVKVILKYVWAANTESCWKKLVELPLFALRKLVAHLVQLLKNHYNPSN